ncbi:MAG: FecR domain-containing protein [Parasphingorhabdus sp.]|uniref:FecR domain-containing protein n=1 Tax=Parasphingorhabdus sp. TaxID=2709688 RepID=UPI003297828D
MVQPITKSVAIIALLSSSAAYAGAPGWQVSEIRGNVTVARNGIIKIAQRQGKLLPGDVIKTGPKGRAILLRGGEYLVVSPSSHIEIAQPEKAGKITQIIEYLGNVLFRIDKKETPHFGVKTPYMAAVVKGTTFSVSVSGDGTAVQVTEGAVEVASLDGGATELVTPGVIGMINASDPFSLVILDGEKRVIESPNKPSGFGQKSASRAGEKSPAPQAQTVQSSDLSGTISVPVGEEGVELAELTNGLISGGVSSDRFILVESAEESVGTFSDVDISIGNEAGMEEDESDVNAGTGSASEEDSGDNGQGDETESAASEGDDDQDSENLVTDDPGDEDQGEVENGEVDGGEPDDTDTETSEDPVEEDQDADGQAEEDQVEDESSDEDQGEVDGGESDDTDTGTSGNPVEEDQDAEDQAEDDSSDEDQDEAESDDGDQTDSNPDQEESDDGNNGHGNDADGEDDSNPGNGNGRGNDDDDDDDDDGNNGHGNDADGEDDSNPGNGNGHGNDADGDDDDNPGRGFGNGRGNDDDADEDDDEEFSSGRNSSSGRGKGHEKGHDD